MRNLQRRLNQGFRVGARIQSLRSEFKVQSPELALADDSGNGLARQAPLRELFHTPYFAFR